jgi:hypothetical protein
MKSTSEKNRERLTGQAFNPHRMVSDEEFCTNMNLIMAYNQIIKGETKKRFTAS